MKIQLVCRQLLLLSSLLLAAIAVTATLPPAFGQPADPSPPEASLDSAQAVDRERTIYVPFSKLREVFEKEGRGVFLPYDQFQQLWDAARAADQKPPPVGPPVDSIITDATSQATVQQDVVQVEAILRIELLKQGWNSVPLRLSGAAIQSATVDGETARLTTAADGYRLLIENRLDRPQGVELKLTYARAFDKSPGQNSVAFAAPQAPVNRWRIRIPQAGVKVDVTPMIAATEAPQSPSLPSDADSDADSDANDAADADAQNDGADETVLLAFVGSAAEVTIRWTPKAEGASGLTALTSVQAQQEVFVAEGAIRTRTSLAYTINRAQLDRLMVDVPGDHKVVNVFDPNVRKWDVTTEGEGEALVQRIAVELFEPATSMQRLAIELEKFVDATQLNDLRMPTVRAMDVSRQQGVVVVRVDPALRAEATTTGLLQLDAAELPAGLANQSWTFAYRYAALPFEFALAVEIIQPRISVQQLVECYLEPELTSLDVLVIYHIEQAGVFQLEVDLPDGFEVLRVSGREAAGAAAAAVDAYHVEGDTPRRLIVNLSRKAIGQIGLWIQLQQRVNDPNLLAPTGTASTIELPLAEPRQDFLNQLTGRLVVYAPESLRLNPTTTTGLRAIAFSEAYAEVSSCREGRFATTRPALAFAFSDQPKQLELSVERRSPYITARQMMVTRIEAGVVKYEVVILYDILYSGVQSLRVDVPASLASAIRNESQSIRDAAMEPPPEDVAAGYVAWSLTGETELIGSERVRLTWEQKINELEVGSSQDIEVPRLDPMQVDRTWGQIVVTKTETLDIQPTGQPEALRPIDPMHDLMRDVPVPDAAQAFEYFAPWGLTLKATRYQLEEVKRTSIERALVRTVVTRSGQLWVQALYRVRSARQRLAVQLPSEAEFDTQPARVNGRPVALERGDQDLLYVPLTGQDPNSEFLLELRYTTTGDQRSIAVPQLPEDPAVQKVYLAVFLPEELALLHDKGPWTEEFTWKQRESWKRVPVANDSDDALASWVSEGISASAAPPFQKDGTLYLFSALRPQPPPEGALLMTAVHENTLAVIVISIVALVGLLLLRATFATKLAAVAGLLMAAVACGVFAPTLGQQLLSLPTIAGLVLIGIAWSTQAVMQVSKRIPWKQTVAVSADRNAAEHAAPPEATVIDFESADGKPQGEDHE